MRFSLVQSYAIFRSANGVMGQAHILLRNGLAPCGRTHEVVEFGAPSAAQTDLRVFFQWVGTALAIDLEQKSIQGTYIAGRQVQTFGAYRWDDIGRIAEQEHTAILLRDRGREFLPIEHYVAWLGISAAHLNAQCR